MPKSDNQKLKLFYIADYLMTETDGDYDKDAEEKHGVYIRDIREHLEKNGIIATLSAETLPFCVMSLEWTF